jgi:protocatechuate 3,4-dioxygenase beta subunit
MDRRKFLFASTMTAIGVSAFGNVKPLADGTFKGDCETTNDILGPFYRANAPITTDMTYTGCSGTPIVIKGKVYSDCDDLLKDALVEIWHANTNGEYDNDSDEFRQRGRQYTDDKGNYSFKTIFPGKYLNGKLYRPAHIHFRISHKETKELISQIYFQGDPEIRLDPWASQSKAKARILPIVPQDIEGVLTVNFDIHLVGK